MLNFMLISFTKIYLWRNDQILVACHPNHLSIFNEGLDIDEAYPYTARNGTCKYDANNVGAEVASSVNISLGAEDEPKSAVGLVCAVT